MPVCKDANLLFFKKIAIILPKNYQINQDASSELWQYSLAWIFLSGQKME